MSPFRDATLMLAVVLAALCLACGGGSSGGPMSSSGGSTTVGASFVPDIASPGPETVALGQQATNGALVQVRVVVTDVDDLYGASFNLTYDPAMARLESWAAGSLLETGGQPAIYQVDDSQSGQIVVAATRLGAIPGVDVTGSATLMVLTFRVERVGSAPVRFEVPALLDGQLQPQPIPSVAWYGGELIGI